MQEQRRRYGCERPLVLSALYDTLEDLQWQLVSANSDAGILIVSEVKTEIPFLIRIGAGQGGEVEVTVDCTSGVHAQKAHTEAAARSLLEALTRTIEDAAGRNGKKRNPNAEGHDDGKGDSR